MELRKLKSTPTEMRPEITNKSYVSFVNVLLQTETEYKVVMSFVSKSGDVSNFKLTRVFFFMCR